MNRLTKPSAQTPPGTAASPRRTGCTAAGPRRTGGCASAPIARLRAVRRARHDGKSKALVRSPAPGRTPGSGSSPKRRVMNLMIDVVS